MLFKRSSNEQARVIQLYSKQIVLLFDQITAQNSTLDTGLLIQFLAIPKDVPTSHFCQVRSTSVRKVVFYTLTN